MNKRPSISAKDELIVGERGPAPKVVPTFPELTCHSAEDLRILNNRAMTSYRVAEEDIHRYEEEVIPYWQGRSMRDRIFSEIPEDWRIAYEAGLFTEFMEQRAPGHTALDGTIYTMGMVDFKQRIADRISRLDYRTTRRPRTRPNNSRPWIFPVMRPSFLLSAMQSLPKRWPTGRERPARREELHKIAQICRRVPAHKPRTFHEALQMYWFVHLGTITELNGWDAMTPGHLDQHLQPFYEKDLAAGMLDREKAKELLSCLWIKVNNHTAPPKVGVTAKESGTYNDFTQINLGGLDINGADASNEVSYICLEVSDELHLLQPQPSVHISSKTPDRFLKAATRVIRKGYGYPSVFNTDAVIMEQVRVGKSVEDAREGGTSGCIETGAFGKEAYILTGYLNVPKILEITLNNGVDPAHRKKGRALKPVIRRPLPALTSSMRPSPDSLNMWSISRYGSITISNGCMPNIPRHLFCRWSSMTALKKAGTIMMAGRVITPTIFSAAASAPSPTACRRSRPMSLTSGSGHHGQAA